LGDMRVTIIGQDNFRWTSAGADVWADGQWNPILYSGSGGAVNPGTAAYQTLSWDTATADWLPNSSLLINYDTGNVTVAVQLAVGNDITVGGTVDGRDVSVDGATLDFHTAGVTAGGVDIHYADAPNIPGTQYAREALGWSVVAPTGAVVNTGSTQGQTLKWDTGSQEWVNTSDVIVTDGGFMGVGVLPTGKISTDGDIVAGVGGFGWLGNGSVGLRGLNNSTQGMFAAGLQTDIRGTDILLDDGSAEGAFLTNGRLGIGTGTPNVASRLDVNGFIYTKNLPLVDGGATIAERFAVVATLPGSPQADTIYFVTN
jgi:hypothetical protein